MEDEPESEVAIPGSKRAVGLFPSSEFLNPVTFFSRFVMSREFMLSQLSPFYDGARRRNNYIMNTHPRPSALG